MKSKKAMILLLIGFVLLIGTAAVLYPKLSKEFGNQPGLQGAGSSAQSQETAGSPGQNQETAGSTGQTAEGGGQTDIPAENGTAASDVQGQPEPVKAPDFTVYDGEGNEVRLSDYQGKPVIINFWASWCGPCKSEMPEFQAAYEEYGQEIEFLMVNLTDGYRETQEKAEEYLEEQGYTFPVYFDTDSDAAITYGVMGIPTTYFIDAEGNAVAAAASALDGETLQIGIDMVLP